jgi:hypothetical protein
MTVIAKESRKPFVPFGVRAEFNVHLGDVPALLGDLLNDLDPDFVVVEQIVEEDDETATNPFVLNINIRAHPDVMPRLVGAAKKRGD